MCVHHSSAAVDLAIKMRLLDAVRLVSMHQAPDLLLPPGAPPVDPLHLEAARVVCGWVDTFGPSPSDH